ncbi:MAG: MFS transporter [Bacillota bacterium]|nr:MFS transporter [Bacillota bacterium]
MQPLNYRKTFLIGFGFFASSLAWSLYNSFVPVMLEERYLQSTALIGFIMTIDNIFGVIFQPLIGQVSDRTRTRFGKRMPYILIGIPACALAFFFIPRTGSLITMMSVIILFNLIMSIWRSPVVSLMPDMTPPIHRSKANGIINLMGGVGGIIAFLAGGYLSNQYGDNMPFLMGSIVMIFALVMLFFFVKEPDSRRMARIMTGREQILAASGSAARDTANTQTIKSRLKGKIDTQLLGGLNGSEKRSLISILLAIFFWFCGYNAVESFFTLYATKQLMISKGDAAMTLTLFSLSLVLFALPAGILAGRIGRKRMIMIGLAGMIATFMPMLFIESIMVLRGLLVVGGLFWACVNINSLPMVVELASRERIGSFTGYYYFFSFSAAILSPTLFGWIRDLTNDYSTLFLYSVIAFGLAFICMLMVRHGEANPDAAAPDDEIAEAANA